MTNIRQIFISELERLNYFKYLDKEEVVFDRCDYEEQVSEELNHHIKEHSYSAILKNQIIDLYGQGFTLIAGYKHPYEPFDIYNSIDDILKGSTKNKPFKCSGSHLRGKDIYHSHHSLSFYSMTNCIRYFSEKYACDKKVFDRLSEIKKIYKIDKNTMTIFANEVLLKSLTWEKKTGEWIVYTIKNGKYNFICLYVHDANDKHDEKLFSLIKGDL